MKIYFVFLIIALCNAEPPAPKYLPGGHSAPASKYLPGGYRAPSVQYGTPSIQQNLDQFEAQYQQQIPSGQFIEDTSSQYGVPSTFIPSGQSNGYNPSFQYKAPSTHRPSMKHGYPFKQQTALTPIKYDTPSNSQPSIKYSIPTHTFSPSAQYGTPSRQSASTYNVQSTKSMQISSFQYGTPQRQYGAPHYTNDVSEPANYNFQYDVENPERGTSFGHEESRHEDQTQGKFSVVLPDGRRQTVEYTADTNGFKPKITYEETGDRYGGYNNGYTDGYSHGY